MTSEPAEKLFVELIGITEGEALEELLHSAKEINPDVDILTYKLGFCEECDKGYKKWRKDQRFCSRKCANRWRVRKWRKENAES